MTSFLISNETIKSKEIYLTYKDYPKRVFTYQKFNVTLNAIILKQQATYDKILTTFKTENNIEVLTKDIIWKEKEANKYTTTITYKIKDSQFKLPLITLALIKNEEVIDYIKVKSPLIKYNKIAVNQKLFSNIIASNLVISTVKTKQYTNKILSGILLK